MKGTITSQESPLSWPRWALDLVTAPTRARPPSVILIIAVMVVVFTALTALAGGAGVIPPHWLYIPIVVAGARFGVFGSVVTALVSGLAVGPWMPADIAAGVEQQTSDWVIRTIFFVLVGTVTSLLTRQTARGIERERHQAASGRRLDQALNQSQLRLHFQPIVAAASGEVTGAEALVRWEAPEAGLLAPEDFVPIAEETGRIVPIGTWVLNEACAQLGSWGEILGDVPLVMSVNVSPAQLANGDLVDLVLDILQKHSLSPSSLCLEITESSIFPDTTRSLDVLASLRHIGVSIAIDDFGSGMSALSYLRSIPFDTIKIDGRFVEDLGKEREAGQVVDSIMRLARDLNKTTVAEKVETGLQWERLAASGCTHGQGYLFSPPLPPSAFQALMASRQVWPAEMFQTNGDR